MKLPKCQNSKCKKRVKEWQRTFCGNKCFRASGPWRNYRKNMVKIV